MMKKWRITVSVILVSFILFFLVSYFNTSIKSFYSFSNDSFSVKDCSPESKTFICRPITQNNLDGQTPIVCGCMPQCRSGEILVISSKPELWPDGSQKGSFGCVKGLVPNSTVKLIGK